MADTDIVTTVRVDGTGGPVTVDVLFGFANIGVYRIFLWDAARTPTQVAFGDNVDHEPDVHVLPVAAADLKTRQLSYEMQIESAAIGAGQMYSVLLRVRQDGEIVPGGSIERAGRLPKTNNKAVIGFVKFEVV
jgi:hypothetical protein